MKNGAFHAPYGAESRRSLIEEASPMTTLLIAALLASGPSYDLPADVFARPFGTVDDAFQRFFEIVSKDEHSSTAWQAERAAAEKLVAFGFPATNYLMMTAEDEESSRKVRYSCYYWLTHAFADDEFVQAEIIRSGLIDPDAGIRYLCAFFLGQHKVYRSFVALRKAMEKAAKDGDSARVRLAAAKSLAELGEPDVLPILYHALGSDRYMERHMANLGIKGLTGKDLNDFDYNYGEGAFVSGGVEMTYLDIHGIEDAEKKAHRFRAIAAYSRWLKQAHPEYYKYLDAKY
jgi:hypothetical protein